MPEGADGAERREHSAGRGAIIFILWIPAFAGMTQGREIATPLAWLPPSPNYSKNIFGFGETGGARNDRWGWTATKGCRTPEPLPPGARAAATARAAPGAKRIAQGADYFHIMDSRLRGNDSLVATPEPG